MRHPIATLGDFCYAPVFSVAEVHTVGLMGRRPLKLKWDDERSKRMEKIALLADGYNYQHQWLTHHFAELAVSSITNATGPSAKYSLV